MASKGAMVRVNTNVTRFMVSDAEAERIFASQLAGKQVSASNAAVEAKRFWQQAKPREAVIMMVKSDDGAFIRLNQNRLHFDIGTQSVEPILQRFDAKHQTEVDSRTAGN